MGKRLATCCGNCTHLVVIVAVSFHNCGKRPFGSCAKQHGKRSDSGGNDPWNTSIVFNPSGHSFNAYRILWEARTLDSSSIRSLPLSFEFPRNSKRRQQTLQSLSHLARMVIPRSTHTRSPQLLGYCHQASTTYTGPVVLEMPAHLLNYPTFLMQNGNAEDLDSTYLGFQRKWCTTKILSGCEIDT